MMKQLILAAIAVLTLGAGSAFAQSYYHPQPPATAHHTTVNGN